MVTKIVITLKADSATVGIEKTDCDPVFFVPAYAGLMDVLATLPGFMEQATAKWATAPRNPVTKFQQPPPPARTTTATPATPPAVPKPASKLQPNMF